MHLLQVALYGAYKRPREVTWWFGLALLGVVQGLALTGYLLPWDQKGYWATKVATNIAGTLPVLGSAMQTLIVGGGEYGQATLTRFYVLHVGVLPAVAGAGRGRARRAVPAPRRDAARGRRPDARKSAFYPGAARARRRVRGAGARCVIALLTARHARRAPRRAGRPDGRLPPRPEWYFLFLFQLLKYLPGSLELVGTVILPGLAGAFLFVLPFLDRGESRRVRDRLPWLAPVAGRRRRASWC